LIAIKARIYEQENSLQQAYLLLLRYATLVTAKIPKHPSARDPEYRSSVNAAVRSVGGVLERLAALKPKITARFEQYQKALERRRQAAAALAEQDNTTSWPYNVHASNDPAVAGNVATLEAAENSDLAVKLAHHEIRRRDAAKRSTRQAGVSEQQEHARRIAGLWDDWEAALGEDGRSRGEKAREDEAMRRDMAASRSRLDGTVESRPERRNIAPRVVRPVSDRDGSNSYYYPSIPKSQQLNNYDLSTTRETELHPPKPPKEHLTYDEPDYVIAPPSVPAKVVNAISREPALDEPAKTFTFRPSAYLENGKPLRTIFLPTSLRTEFLSYAQPNTRNNLETCGVLCGTLISNALFISRVVIPEQISTSDTCETTNEVALFDYCEKEDLMVLGWIHTHPTQTCFMSSRDLHTHFGYQTMISESIAIVCAPSKNPS